MYSLGQAITGTIIEKVINDGKMKIQIDINDPSNKAFLFWNSGVKEQMKFLNVGDEIDGWIVKIENNEIGIGITKFGKFPPKPKVIERYIESLLAMKKYLQKYSQGILKIKDLEPEKISEVKGLFNRCIRRDQWDWYIVYKGFNFENEHELKELGWIISSIRSNLKRKTSLEDIEDTNQEWFSLLAKTDFLKKVDSLIDFLINEGTNWEIIRQPIPLIIKKGLKQNNHQDKKLIRIKAHLRKGYKISIEQHQRLQEILLENNLELNCGTIITNENFKEIDWDNYTIVFPFTKDILRETNLELNKSREDYISSELETNIKRERANNIHQLLVQTMAQVLNNNNLLPLENKFIDLYTNKDDLWYIFEMKSITVENESSQIRKAVSQLYEYRFLHQLREAMLCIVLSSPPKEKWILDYLIEDRNINVCWWDKDRFNYPERINSELKDLLDKVIYENVEY
ncbi:hypothetical protein [Bacillus sp. AFS041924]|uniref:hypothetical protein n=1 Tax=Bacillus sp. AFS041924 TaxID=2033503 RepID=UPI000BFBEF5E|nr:hypothetical protein [Bacillus sp. AFS041924]PGS53856.1 hypothetical protein COC46_06545 [Bacillus sp. AFS041924]